MTNDLLGGQAFVDHRHQPRTVFHVFDAEDIGIGAVQPVDQFAALIRNEQPKRTPDEGWLG